MPKIITMPALAKTHLITLIRLVSFVLFILFENCLYAQSSKLDSLRTAIAQAKENNSRVVLEIELAIEYLKTNSESALQLIEKVYPYVEESGDQELLFKVLFTKGRIYENRQQLDSALVTYETAKNLAASINDKVNVASCLIQMGYVYHEKNESQKGLGLLKEALA